MKLLPMCVAIAITAGVAAAPHVARAQALGEAATLSAGVSSAGSASGSSLGGSIGRAMGSEGHRMSSSDRTSTSGGVTTFHWSRRESAARKTRSRAGSRAESGPESRAGSGSTTGNKNAQPDFVIFGADPQVSDADPGQAANHKGQSGKKK